MPIIDIEKKQLAQKARLHSKICMKCRAKNSINAKRCRKCKTSELRLKYRSIMTKTK